MGNIFHREKYIILIPLLSILPPTHLFHVLFQTPLEKHYNTITLLSWEQSKALVPLDRRGYVHTCAGIAWNGFDYRKLRILEKFVARNLIKDRPRSGFERGTARIALSLAFTARRPLLGTPKCLPASLICTRLLPHQTLLS